MTDEPTCPSCDKPYADHLGLTGTCELLQEERTENERLRASSRKLSTFIIEALVRGHRIELLSDGGRIEIYSRIHGFRESAWIPVLHTLDAKIDPLAILVESVVMAIDSRMERGEGNQ